MEVGIFDLSFSIGRAYDSDAGFDLKATEPHELLPQGEVKIVKTGLHIALPQNLCAFVLPRSGLAAKYGVTVNNSPGLIDPGYLGEIMVAMVNHHPSRTHHVAVGDRIAQLLFVPFVIPTFKQVHFKEDLKEVHGELDKRGESGFGSSGK